MVSFLYTENQYLSKSNYKEKNMKKILIFTLSMLMLFSFVGCGSEGETTTDTEGTLESSEEMAETETTFEEDLEAIRPLLVHNFAGHGPSETDPYGGVSFSEDYSNAVFLLFNGQEYYTFMGEAWIDEETGNYMIDDPAEEFLITFAFYQNDDGTYTLDAGDLGSILVVETNADAIVSLLQLFALSE